MHPRLIYPKEVTDQEARRLAEPAALASIVFCVLLILLGLERIAQGKLDYIQVLLGFLGILYALVLFYIIMPSPVLVQKLKWPIMVAQVLCVTLGFYLLSGYVRVFPLVIMVLIAIILLVVWNRQVANVFLLLSTCTYFLIAFFSIPLTDIIYQSSFFLTAVIFLETIERLYISNQRRVKRLQVINDFARHVSLSLELPEMVQLIGQAIKNTLDPEAYFFGLREDDKLNIQLFYDDGEFYPPEKVSLSGSLSSWVIDHQQSLFIPDLRNDVDLEGVKLVLLGKEKTSLCWMGVPLHAQHVDGILAVSSYKPNDFNRTDLELLENLAQQAAMALDNAFHHAKVEEQSHLDSLTGAYNHGYIVDVLKHEAEACKASGQPLSLIMMDIDYFKLYNDNYGHVVGDQVLSDLTRAVRHHIKGSDSIGRWGGEEFTIVLPGTSGPQAQVVAERIQQTVASMTLRDRDGKQLPFPTVSQGLAVFPEEMSDVYKLIDLADQRLYTAKQRGRNQIEPKPEDWKITNK